jgi:hypothetical protein
MRKCNIISVFSVLFCMMFSLHMKANPCCGQTDSSCHKHGTSVFYSFNYGINNVQASTSFNKWLLSNGYSASGTNEYTLGFTEMLFHKKWVYEMSVNYLANYGYNNAPTTMNWTIGAGYRFLKTRFFNAYGAIDLGLNEMYLKPNAVSLLETGQTSANQGAYFYRDAFLVNPHILLYRNVTSNLSMRPGHDHRIGAGIEAGFNGALLPGYWWYQKSMNDFNPARIKDIPRSSFSGFYVMGKIGWYFTR